MFDDLASERTCVFCGCTDERACPGGCVWMDKDPEQPEVCSTCYWRLDDALKQIRSERERQAVKHGDQSQLPDGTGHTAGRAWLLLQPFGHVGYGRMARLAREETDLRSQAQGDGSVTFADILLEEVFEALAESEPAKLRAELVQVAAVAVQWIEAIDRRDGLGEAQAREIHR